MSWRIFLCSLVFAFTDLNYAFANSELKRAELLTILPQTQQTDTRFHLYKELFALQVQSYRANQGDVNSLGAAIRIATTDPNRRQKCIDKFNKEEKEIFTSYDAMLNLAEELATNALIRNTRFHFTVPFDVTAFQPAEPLQLYSLQILELEESLNIPIHGVEFMIREQTAALTGLFLSLKNEITAMVVKGVIKDQAELALESKELNFYWSTIVNLCYELLEQLDNRWTQSNYDRKKILYLVFSFQSTFFPIPSLDVNPIHRFLPFILKHATLELAKNRFDQIYEKFSAWDRNFAWVALHIKVADDLLASDPKKAKTYLEKAKELAYGTLWCYSFSWDRAHWNQRQEEALKMIESRLPLFN